MANLHAEIEWIGIRCNAPEAAEFWQNHADRRIQRDLTRIYQPEKGCCRKQFAQRSQIKQRIDAGWWRVGASLAVRVQRAKTGAHQGRTCWRTSTAAAVNRLPAEHALNHEPLSSLLLHMQGRMNPGPGNSNLCGLIKYHMIRFWIMWYCANAIAPTMP